MIVDNFDRVHTYLRISLTDNCNLRCFYCMPEEEYAFTPSSKLMQLDEIVKLAKIFVQEGVTKIRLTGGEPLVRKDAGNIIEELSKLPVSLTLTSNGTTIHHYFDLLKRSSIRSVNISLDTLQAETFQHITRRDSFAQVYQNILWLIDNGFEVKINVVVMKGLNDAEVNDFIAWTKDTAIAVRFIEFMPFEGNQWTSNKVFTWQQILDRVQEKYLIKKLDDHPNDTAKHYSVPGHKGSFAVISTMSAPFCTGCNRMRLTADGKMKNCLFSPDETDLLGALRKGEDPLSLIRKCIGEKAKGLGGQMPEDFEQLHAEEMHNRSMITIGG